MRRTTVRRPKPKPPPEPEFRGREKPWVYGRLLDSGGAYDLTCWILHTKDCPLAAVTGPLPAICGQGAVLGHLGVELAYDIYMNLENVACALCKPGILLRENVRADTALALIWAQRGGV